MNDTTLVMGCIVLALFSALLIGLFMMLVKMTR